MGRLIFITVLFIILFFLLTHYVLNLINNTIIEDLILSIVVGIIWIISMKNTITSKRFDVKLDTEKEIIKQQGANHFKKMEGVGGKLFLFRDSLFFKSHKYNIQRHSLSIPFSEIKSYNIYKLFGVFPLGFKVNTLNSKEIFFMDKPQEWMKAIRNTIPQSV